MAEAAWAGASRGFSSNSSFREILMLLFFLFPRDFLALALFLDFFFSTIVSSLKVSLSLELELLELELLSSTCWC